MKMKSFVLAAGLMLAIPAVAATYTQAGGSALAFATKYQGQTFTGTFQKFNTVLVLDPANLAKANLNVTINIGSAKTGDTERDQNLLGAEFFAPDKFPQATFKSSKISKGSAANSYVADGVLTLRGVSKPVRFTFTLQDGASAILIGRATVRRLDFGVGGSKQWNDLSIIPNDVAVSTRVILKKAP